MQTDMKRRSIIALVLVVIVSYVLILGGISLCNRSYGDTHKGIFTDEFAHNINEMQIN
ncbi:MAG: hypothetical protein ACRDAU_09235 [Clostridium sp.]